MTPCIRSSEHTTIFVALSAHVPGYGLGNRARDFAVQCSLDHPWLKSIRNGFVPSGRLYSICGKTRRRNQRNIVNPEFYGPDRNGVWTALRDVVLFWVSQGVRIFRVDNPHTKPFPFLGMADPRGCKNRSILTYVFLAEAFRPKVMKALAKLGFTQS